MPLQGEYSSGVVVLRVANRAQSAASCPPRPSSPYHRPSRPSVTPCTIAVPTVLSVPVTGSAPWAMF